MAISELPSPARLRERLSAFDDRWELLRLVAALNYQNDVPPSTIAAMYGVSERTVYNWLERFRERPLEAAVADRSRPGRPPALPTDQRDELEAALSGSPSEQGYGTDAWTAPLVRRFVSDRFDVEYSERHAARLLDRYGAEE